MKKVLILIICLFLCGCTNYVELDKLAIMTGMGIDLVDGEYKITVQIADTQKQGTGSTTSTSPVRFKNYSYTDESIHGAARRVMTEMPKKIYSNHLQLLVLSESIIKENIGDIIDFLFREVELRSDFYVLVSKDCTPEDILGVVTQVYPINAVGINKLLTNNSKYLGSSALITFDDLTNYYITKTKEIVLPVITIDGEIDKSSSDKNLESSIPESLLKIDGMALFKGNEFSFYLNSDDSIYYNLSKNGIDVTVIDYECEKEKYVTIEILDGKSDIKITKNKPEVTIKVKTKGNLTSSMCEYKIDKEEGIKQIEAKAEEEIKKNILKVIDISKEYNSDIFDIRDIYFRKNNTFYKKLENNYDEFYKNLQINVDVELDLFEKGNGLQVIENEKDN